MEFCFIYLKIFLKKFFDRKETLAMHSGKKFVLLALPIYYNFLFANFLIAPSDTTSLTE